MRIYRYFGLLLLLSITSASAQQSVSEASLSGAVTDVTAAVVVGATVTARNADTNQSQTMVTDGQGRFRFPYLPIGQYEVTTHRAGFHDDRRLIELSLGSEYYLRITLQVAVFDLVVVTGSESLVTGTSEISGNISLTELQSLPYQGRNYIDAALLVPGVSPTNTASTQTLAETSEIVGQGFSVNSQRNFSNSFIVDGLSANDDAAGVAGNVFGMDVVREFQVVTSGGQAEFGRALGGYFNIVTKTGTNVLHGTAYGFLRNQRMNANNALSGSRLPLTQGQYGASLSGPLRRDRSFLFGNFEEGRLNTNGVIAVSPANAALINTRLQTVGYAAPLLPVGTGSTTRYPSTLHTDTLFVRGDQLLGEKDRLTVRYSLYQLSSINARGVGGLNEASNGTSVYDTNHTIAINNIATLRPWLSNETRGQFSYDDLNAPPNDTSGPAVTISGVAIFGRSTNSPTARRNYLYEVVDNLVLEAGRHTFKIGLDVLDNQDTITYPQSLRGSYSFSSMANFLSGTYNAQGYTQNFGTPTVKQGNPNLGFYAQDEWRLGRSLTVNAGLRYDLQWLRTVTTDTNNVSPRVGLAWSPFAHGRTVVRASYGIFYDRIPLRPLANALLSADNTIDPGRASFFSYTFSPGDAGAPVFPAVALAPPSGAKPNYALMDSHVQNPNSQQISLGVEQRLATYTTLRLSYQHLRGEHLISSYNTNINIDGTRPDPTRGNIKPYSSIFDSYFDGLAVSLQHRQGRWGSVRVSYMWSKAIDDVGEFFFSSPINNFFPGEDRSRSDDDQRHRLVVDAVLKTSTRSGHTWESRITHDWMLSGILQYYSRLPFNITTGANTKQATAQRPCTAGYTLTANGGLNPCTEALPGAVVGRNAGTGFDYFNLSARLNRTFTLGNLWKLQTMVEAFNSLNHRNDMVPNGTWGTGAYRSTPNATFGQATAVGDARSVQLGARLEF